MAAETRILNWWELPLIDVQSHHPAKTKLRMVQGNIVKIRADAIVNSANDKLKAGDGVCGAIFAATTDKGDALQAECNQIGFCPTGSSVITRSYGLPSDYIIHAVGPQCATPGKPTGEEQRQLIRCCEYTHALNPNSGASESP